MDDECHSVDCRPTARLVCEGVSHGDGCMPAELLSAAKSIHDFWLGPGCRITTAKLIQQYLVKGPLIEKVKAFSFEALVPFLREKDVIHVSKACLHRVHGLCLSRHGSHLKANSPESINARVFLAAFMIAYRPSRVFESIGALEQSLLESALSLVELFEEICISVNGSSLRCFADVPHQLSKAFPVLLFQYLRRFKAWKLSDEAKLLGRIQHALLALYRAAQEQDLAADERKDENTKVQKEFHTQIKRLRFKLQQIGGNDALRRFDERHPSPASFSVRDGISVSQSPISFADRLTNELLVHELLLNPTFQFDEDGSCLAGNPVFQHIRKSFQKAFWQGMIDDLKLAPTSYVRVLRVVEEVRDGIFELAGQQESACIMEAVDLDFIKQQTEKGLFGWESSVRLIASVVEVIQKTQDPKRKEETKMKWKACKNSLDNAGPGEQPRSFCDALEFLVERVNALRIDSANARLREIAQIIRENGMDYERNKLQDKLDSGSISLERTKIWICRTLKREVATASIDVKEVLDGRATAFISLHIAGMLALVTDSAVVKADTCPETMLLDVQRLSNLQMEFRYHVQAAAMLATVAHGLTGVPNPTKAQAQQAISGLFLTREARDLEQTLSEVLKCVDGLELAAEQRQILRRALIGCTEPTNAVHKLMNERIETLWKGVLLDGRAPRDSKLINAARALVPRVEQAAGLLRAVGALNRAVHGGHYDRIIAEAAARLGASPNP